MWLETMGFYQGSSQTFPPPGVLAVTHSYDWLVWWTCSRNYPPPHPPYTRGLWFPSNGPCREACRMVSRQPGRRGLEPAQNCPMGQLVTC